MKKEQELNKFIRPARKNEKIVDGINQINAAWTRAIRKELIRHYTEEKFWSFEFIFDYNFLFTADEIMELGHQVLTWAKKNYGKKLRQSTIDEFLVQLPRARPSAPPSPECTTSPIPMTQSPLEPSPKPKRQPVARKSPQNDRPVTPPTIFSVKPKTAPSTSSVSVKPVAAPPTGFSVKPIAATSARTPSKKNKAPPTRVSSPLKRTNRLNQKPKAAPPSKTRLMDNRSKINKKPVFTVPNRFTFSKNSDPFVTRRASTTD
ncbi:hypothetical protein SNE40_012711 [Patella caerulea]|uniref:Uncharacterized protein n=1 Tax=Patella caerulea TaxID=87958 RepID=A0AAN8PWG8_PATCE